MAERSIESIYKELVSAIESQAGSSWSALKDSMVGRELLYAGANIISATERVSSSVLGVLDVGRYGLDQLISYAYGQDVSLDVSRPGSVKVRIVGSPDVVGGVFAPFSLKMTIGILSFYNIDYCGVGDVITLYCGAPCAVLSGAAISLPFVVRSSTYESWRLYVELSGGSYRSSYLKLDDSVMSSSVWVFAQARSGNAHVGPVFPYTAYNAMLSAPEARLYKVRRLWDYSTAVLFGDGNWAQEVLPQQYDYCVVWLRGEYGNFTVTQGVGLTYRDAMGVQSEWRQGEMFEVVSSQMGVSRSVSYARNYLVSEVFKTQGLVTGVQLENFVLSFPTVQSAHLSLSKNLVSVYVKPEVEGDTAFDFITDYLYQYGVSGVTYQVSLGTRLCFLIRLRSTGSLVMSELSRAASLLGYRYSYDNVTMSTRVSSSLVQQELSLQGIRSVVATLYGRVYLDGLGGGSLKLTSSAAVGSIKQYDSEGLVVGFDSEGRFKSYESLTELELSSMQQGGVMVSGVGDFWWLNVGGSLPASYLVSVLDDGRLGVASADVAFSPISGGVFAPYGEGLYCMMFWGEGGMSIKLYRSSSVFRSGVYSLFNHPSYVTPLSYVVGTDSNGLSVRSDVFTLREYTVAEDGVSVSVLSVLGATGVGTSSDAVVCAIGLGGGSGNTSVYGLGVYRLGSAVEGVYYWDLVLMYGGSTEALVKLSSYYDGQWYMPVGEGSQMSGIGVYVSNSTFTSIVDIRKHVTDAEQYTAWSKIYRLESVESVSGVLESSDLVDWRVVSASSAWVVYKTGELYALGSMQFTLITQDTGSSVCQYRFDKTYSIPVDKASSEVPLRLSIVNGSPVVYGENGSTGVKCWWVLPAEGTGLSRLALGDGCIVTVTGSVDYEQGIVYGLQGVDGGYVEYEVASVLGGDGSYPYLLDIVSE